MNNHTMSLYSIYIYIYISGINVSYLLINNEYRIKRSTSKLMFKEYCRMSHVRMISSRNVSNNYNVKKKKNTSQSGHRDFDDILTLINYSTFLARPASTQSLFCLRQER